MTPILFHTEETTFNTNGIGFLTDCISCLVTEERNGIFEVEFEYPITGLHYAEIQEGMIIGVSHDETKILQPFRIYRRSAKIDGIVTFNARHVAYELQNVILGPYTANNIVSALAGFKTNALTDCPFTFWTDKSTNGTFEVTTPVSVWERLGGSTGSILDVYGTGEWEFDKWTCKLHLHRGSDNGVSIRYGKNLLDIENIIEDDGTYNAVIPYWQDAETLVTVVGDLTIGSSVALSKAYWTNNHGAIMRTEGDDPIEFGYFKLKAVPYDFSEKFDEQPTKAQLNAAALTYLNNNKPWIPSQNITVDFVALWQTEEYENYALLQRVKLCDTVTVIYPELGVHTSAKVIRVVWNALKERYDEIELGAARATYADLITDRAAAEALSQVVNDQTNIEAAIEHATDLITGGLGGHIVIVQDANGKPVEILAMDTEDVSTAVNVLRINVNGIGFSSNGVNGPFTTAWTLDGHFVADFITTGTLDGQYFSCINLNAVNATVSGLFKAAIDANNYIQIDSGHMQLFANANKTISVEHSYSNGSVVGGKISMFDGNSTERLKIDSNSVNNTTQFYMYHNSGDEGTFITDNGFWLFPKAGYYSNGNYPVSISHISNSQSGQGIVELKSVANGGNGVQIYVDPTDEWGVMRLKNSGDPQNNYITTLARNGLWFYSGGSYVIMLTVDNGIYTSGNLLVGGSKNRRIKTKDYGHRILYAMETAEPYFTDIGEAEICKNGTCEIPIDEIFAETVDLEGYQVFLQKYGKGDCWVADRREDRFVVEGDPGLKFAWELKAHQIDHEGHRLEESYIEGVDDPGEAKGKKRGKSWTLPHDLDEVTK